MNNFIKWFFIIFINIIILVLSFFVLDFLFYKWIYCPLEFGYHHNLPYNTNRSVFKSNNIKDVFLDWREPDGLEYKDKKNILVFGCSYGYGFLLSPDETISGKLSNALKRPVINFSSSGMSTQYAIMQMRSGMCSEYMKNTDYVVLVTIGEHVWRVHVNANGFPINYTWPRFQKKGNSLILHKVKIPYIEGSYLYKCLRKFIYVKLLAFSDSELIHDYLFDFLKLHYYEIRKEIQKYNQNAKVVIVVYPDNEKLEWLTYSDRWKELEDDGFIVFKVGDHIPQIHQDKYKIPNDGHPSALAWDEIVPLLVDYAKFD